MSHKNNKHKQIKNTKNYKKKKNHKTAPKIENVICNKKILDIVVLSVAKRRLYKKIRIN